MPCVPPPRLQSLVTAYEYGLGASPHVDEAGQPDMVPFVHVGLSTQAAVVDIKLAHAHVYYGGVRTRVRVPGVCL